jgi:hypothetical protein
MNIKRTEIGNFSVHYTGQNPMTGKYQTIVVAIVDAIDMGETFVSSDKITFKLYEGDKLAFQVYKNCRHLDVKIEVNHEFTMKEMVNICPNILINLVENKGGLDYIAKVLIGYEELYNQQNNK